MVRPGLGGGSPRDGRPASAGTIYRGAFRKSNRQGAAVNRLATFAFLRRPCLSLQADDLFSDEIGSLAVVAAVQSPDDSYFVVQQTPGIDARCGS